MPLFSLFNARMCVLCAHEQGYAWPIKSFDREKGFFSVSPFEASPSFPVSIFIIYEHRHLSEKKLYLLHVSKGRRIH